MFWSNPGQRWWFVFGAVLLLLPVVRMHAQEEEKLSGDLQAMQGEWRLVSLEVDSKRRGPTPDEQAKVLAIEPKQMQFGDAKFAFKIDSSTTPKLFDVTLLAENNQEILFEGIYRLEKEQLDLCVFLETQNRRRPTEFATQEGSKLIVLEFKRQE